MSGGGGKGGGLGFLGDIFSDLSWTDGLKIGTSLYGIYAGRKGLANQEDAAKAEAQAILKATAIQTDRDLKDMERGRMRSLASINAMSAAAGVNPGWGTPVTLKNEVSRQHGEDRRRLLEDAELRAGSLALSQHYLSKSTSLNKQAVTIDGIGRILERVL